jgi:hypothetical protein
MQTEGSTEGDDILAADWTSGAGFRMVGDGLLDCGFCTIFPEK